jgi:adenosylhomocysteine nucleosidase
MVGISNVLLHNCESIGSPMTWQLVLEDRPQFEQVFREQLAALARERRVQKSVSRVTKVPQRSRNIGIVAGMAAEARIVRSAGRVIAGGGTAIGAEKAANRLIGEDVRALISFGVSGGLDPDLQPGALVVPIDVWADGERFKTDTAIVEALGGPTLGMVIGSSSAPASSTEKRRLWKQTGAAAVDMESGSVARIAGRHRLPFAVLRVVCDPAERSLPRAALLALNKAGGIRVLRVLASATAAPSQLPALFALARDAHIARRALIRCVAELRDRLAYV